MLPILRERICLLTRQRAAGNLAGFQGSLTPSAGKSAPPSGFDREGQPESETDLE